MAKIIRKGRNLEDEYLRCRAKARKRKILAILILAGSVAGGMLALPVGLLLGLVAIGIMVSVVPLNEEMNILAVGIEGENLANRCIACLPESYTAFRNMNVSYQGKISETDTIVVGPTGIFVVEIKNLKGSIYGDANTMRWVQRKIGRAGTPYSKVFYNPIKQVNTHVYRVANRLRENGVHVYVNAVVFFSNVNAFNEITTTAEKTPVFFARDDGANQMLHFIISNNQRLSKEEVDKIIRAFQNMQ